jgi:hypothetical protein
MFAKGLCEVNDRGLGFNLAESSRGFVLRERTGFVRASGPMDVCTLTNISRVIARSHSRATIDSHRLRAQPSCIGILFAMCANQITAGSVP